MFIHELSLNRSHYTYFSYTRGTQLLNTVHYFQCYCSHTVTWWQYLHCNWVVQFSLIASTFCASFTYCLPTLYTASLIGTLSLHWKFATADHLGNRSTVLPTALVKGKLLVLRALGGRVVQVAAVNGNVYKIDTHELHCIQSQFSYHGVKSSTRSSHFFLYFMEQRTKDKDKLWRSQ